MGRFFFYIFLVLFITIRLLIKTEKYEEGDRIRITSRVLQEPQKYKSSQRIFLEGFSFYLNKYPEISYGDAVVVEGVVSGKKLDNAVLLELEKNNNFLFGFRKRIIDFYEDSLPEPHSSLISGIVLGSKANIPSDFWNDLKNTGTMHVVVASGMNVAFVAGFLISFLTVFVSRKKALPLSLLGIWFYALLSGFDAPILRAAVMLTITLGAWQTGRISHSWNALVASCLLMLVVKPVWLFDLGFILSFVATASLILFQRRIEKKLSFIPNILRQNLSTTLAAQIGVTPILFVTFGQFNLLSPFINALILWTIPPIMILGSTAGILGLLFPFLGRLVLYISYPLTFFFTEAVKTFSFN